MSDLYLDTETFSPVDIANGTRAYTRAAMPLVVTWAEGDGPVQHAVVESRVLPKAFVQAFNRATRRIAHNAQFDRAVLEECGLTAPLETWHCTMNQAYAHGLPGSLHALCVVLRVAQGKLDGRRFIRLFCTPDENGQRTRLDDRPDDRDQFIEYARQDIVSLREVHKKLPDWNESRERAIRAADAAINRRGFRVDVELARAIVEQTEAATVQANARLVEITHGECNGATDRFGLLRWLKSEDFEVKSLDSASIDGLLSLKGADALPPNVREALTLRQRFAQSSVSKYTTALAQQVEGRICYSLQYAGAQRTRRWSGRGFQPQNMPRPVRKQPAIAAAIDAFLGGAAVLLDDPIDQAVDCLRSTIIPSPGKQFTVADLSNIEGRMLAWVAGEEWKLQAFRDFDAGQGPDIYVASYAAAFGIPIDQVTPEQRQVGKVMELALGYQGGVGAFVTMAKGFNIDLDALAREVCKGRTDMDRLRSLHERAYGMFSTTAGNYMPLDTFVGIKLLVERWRRAHPATVKLWSDIQQAFFEVAAGAPDTIAEVNGMLVDRVGGCVRLLLPSGRYLCYHGLRIDPRTKRLACANPTDLGRAQFGPGAKALSYLYGGKIVENICQSLARDLLAETLVDLDTAPGVEVVLHVHDEIIVEAAPTWFHVEDLVRVLTRDRSWTKGLPLAAAGFHCDRYQKG